MASGDIDAARRAFKEALALADSSGHRQAVEAIKGPDNLFVRLAREREVRVGGGE